MHSSAVSPPGLAGAAPLARPVRRAAARARERRAVSASSPPGRDIAPSRAVRSDYTYEWLPKHPLVALTGFFSWFAASNVSVPAFGNNSLFGRFREAIVQELAHWPVGPALTDPFWLYLVLWHAGLFTVLLLGQIGYEGRRQGYFD